MAAQPDESTRGRQDRTAGTTDPSEATDPRVRPADPAARRLLAEATRRSYTIARLIETVERSDVVVYVYVSYPPGKLPTSQTRLLFTGPNGWRYASVWIDQRLLPLRRLEMLGHELQHVVEIGEARDVTDADSVQRLYERIGYISWHDRAFETNGATVVELQVGQELLANPGSIGASPDEHSLGDGPAAHRRLYDAYCMVCHGRDGRGRGPAARVMSTPPPDLTVLAQRRGGSFPWSDVEQCIRTSERRPSAAAAAGMPVWTELQAAHGESGAAVHARDIAAYLESLQRR